jgi:hypothetical protein
MIAAMLLAGILTAATPVQGERRSFRLGFTPFPYDISLAAVDFSYHSLAKDADLVAHHLDDGVPWDEASRGVEFPLKVRNDWSDRVRRSPKGHPVYLALTPLNLGRDALATDLSDDKKDVWRTIPFDDEPVRKAYLRYCRQAIATFHPSYLAIGIETNLLRAKAPARWGQYVSLHRFIYRALKREHPALPIFDSIVGTALLPGYAPEYDHSSQMSALDDLMPTSDFFAISLYPYMSAYLTERIPDDMFGELKRLDHGKPMAIAESGYPAKEFSIAAGKLVFRGSEEKQADWIRRLLEAADRYRFRFAVNFVIRDYEPLFEKLGKQDLHAIWKNTGLYDAEGKPRPSLNLWRKALERRYQAP